MSGPSVEDLVERYLEAYRSGTASDIESFAAAYPEKRDELTALLPLVVGMEDIGGQPAAVTPPEDFELPAWLGTEFQLTRLIGRGGMGTVFEACQSSLGRRCAVKILSGDLAADRRHRDRFTREARVIARLHHPNIIGIHSAGATNGYYYYAMELVDGTGLDGRTCTPEETARIGLQAARALAYAHSCGVLHCDIKPSNILLAPDGTVRVGDFGLARMLGEDEGEAGGTLRYMAPERLEHAPFSGGADQYALGVTLRELLLGRPLFGKVPKEGLKEAILRGLPAAVPGAPADLASVLAKMTARDPERRYPTLDAAAEDLSHYLAHEPVSARSVSRTRRLWLWARRRPGAAAASAAALLCAAGAVAALCVGYRMAGQARDLAEHNAAVAEAALDRIFAHIRDGAPSKASAALLAELRPYYSDLVAQGGLGSERLAAAFTVVGTAAMRSGDYAAAAEAFAECRNLAPGAEADTRYASALRRAGRIGEADALDAATAARYADAPAPEDRLEAVTALASLSGNQPANLARAQTIVRELAVEDPENPEIRYRLALLLLRTDERRAAEEAADLLGALIETDPADTRFAVNFLGCVTDLLGAVPRRPGARAKAAAAALGPKPRHLTAARTVADRLLATAAGDPDAVAAVLRFQVAYARWLQVSGNRPQARLITDRLYGILDVLFYNPNVPAEAQEYLIEILLERLDAVAKGRNFENIGLLKADLEEKLSHYAGERADEFRKTFESVCATVGTRPEIPAPRPEPQRNPNAEHRKGQGRIKAKGPGRGGPGAALPLPDYGE